MEIKRKFEMSVATNRRYIIRQATSGKQIACAECGEPMLTTEQAAGLFGITLPQPDVTWSFMKPVSVFFENVDRDSEKELLILEEAESGAGPTGAIPFYRTRVYDWTGSEFKHLEEISDKISVDADTAGKVRQELKKIIK